MAISNTYEWNKNGTKQSDRLPKALLGDYVKIDERSFDDLLAQMAEYAKRLVYFDDNMKESGDWTDFFRDVYDYDNHKVKKEHIEVLSAAGDIPPHLALMMGFLKMFQVEQANLNTLTERHLQFYYKDILGFKPKIGSNGNATVFFEPAKNVSEIFVPQGTQFDAGKDSDGRPITFRSVRDVTINQVKVEEYLSFSKNAVKPEQFELIITSPLLSHINEDTIGKVTFYKSNDIAINNNGLNISLAESAIHVKATNDPKKLTELIESFNYVKVDITNSTDFTMHNPQGALANQIGTMPFGAQPKKYDFFTICDITNAVGITVNMVNIVFNNYKTFKTYKDSPTTGIKVTLLDNLNWKTYNQELQSYINALKNGTAIANSLPQMPQAPSLSSPITIDYTLKVFRNKTKLLFITPFGSIDTLNEGKDLLQLLPEDTSVCIKTQGIDSEGNVTLYFKMNPFGYVANGNYGNGIPKWHYFTPKGWKELDATDIQSDSTDHFQQSGIIQLKINKETAQAASKVGMNGFWIMATSTADSNPFVAFEEVRAQAVEVELDPTSKGQIAHGTTLPSGSITKATIGLKGIKKVEQPFVSDDGIEDESYEKFYCRIGEKLRHKGRAWSCWDYERLVLEHFPQVANVKCLPSCDKDGLMKPGQIVILVTTDPKHISQSDPLKPSISKTLKNEIEAYLKEKAPVFVTINVMGPQYIEAKIKCTLVLKQGYTDKKYYGNLLNEQLKQFLAPWSTKRQAVEFSTNKNESHIQEFIENQEYIDHILEFTLFIGNKEIGRGESLQRGNTLSIVTSASQHIIDFK